MLNEELQGEKGAAKGARMRGRLKTLWEFIESVPPGSQAGLERQSRQTGGYIPRTGLYNLHEGETVTMRGSTPPSGGGDTSITLDFSGANISIASGIELEQFADVISNRIAEKQHRLSY